MAALIGPPQALGAIFGQRLLFGPRAAASEFPSSPGIFERHVCAAASPTSSHGSASGEDLASDQAGWTGDLLRRSDEPYDLSEEWQAYTFAARSRLADA
jgi:hypothetical protein